MDVQEVRKLDAYLKRVFSNPKIRVVPRPKKDDSAEVYIGEEFIGVLFVDDLLAQKLVHKTVLSVLSWIVFGVLLIGRRRYGWRGMKAVHWTLAAMLLLLLAFFGSQFVIELVFGHSR